MSETGPLVSTPYFFLGRRRYREVELASYLRREHRRGRHFKEILNDPYVEHCDRSLVRAVLRRPELIRGFRRDVADGIAQSRPEQRR